MRAETRTISIDARPDKLVAYLSDITNLRAGPSDSPRRCDEPMPDGSSRRALVTSPFESHRTPRQASWTSG